MVKITFRLSGAATVTLDMENSTPLAEGVRRGADMAGIRLGGYIAVRRGQVVAADTLIGGEDVIDVFPALSGG